MTSILVDDVATGDRVLYPVQGADGATADQARTVSGIVEYPATRVLYFTEGGFGVADRVVELELAPRPLLVVLAEHVAELTARRLAAAEATARSLTTQENR